MEVTAQKADWREQYDVSTPHLPRKDSDPLYYNLLAPNQWPRDELLPDFKLVVGLVHTVEAGHRLMHSV